MSLTVDSMYPINLFKSAILIEFSLEYSIADEQLVSGDLPRLAATSFAATFGGFIHEFNPFKSKDKVSAVIKSFV
jgi:hypothetical protein